MIVSYTDLRDELAAILCAEGKPPCDRCVDAANRLVVHRRSVRQLLARFANQEAGLLDDPRDITPADLRTMVMQEESRCQGCEDAPVGMTVTHDEGCERA